MQWIFHVVNAESDVEGEAMDVDDEGPEEPIPIHPLDSQINIQDHIDGNEQDLLLEAEDEQYVGCICGDLEKDDTAIQCDGCNTWYHISCVGLTQTQAEEMDQFICAACGGKKNKNALYDVKAQKAQKKQPGYRLPKPANYRDISKKSNTPCANPRCGKMARVGSKYCSHQCGLDVAVQILRKEEEDQRILKAKQTEEYLRAKFPELENDKKNGVPVSLLDEEDLHSLEALRSEFKDLQVAKAEVARDKSKLLAAIEAATSYAGAPESTTNNESNKKGQSKRKVSQTVDVVDCVGCGHSITSARYFSHAISCFVKHEKEGGAVGSQPNYSEDGSALVTCDYYDQHKNTYCKKLKASCVLHSPLYSKKPTKQDSEKICGYPLGKNNELCLKSRKDCPKHQDWVSIRQSSILLLEISHQQLEKSLLYDEKIIMARMLGRHGMLPTEYNIRQRYEELLEGSSKPTS